MKVINVKELLNSDKLDPVAGSLYSHIQHVEEEALLESAQEDDLMTLSPEAPSKDEVQIKIPIQVTAASTNEDPPKALIPSMPSH